jgi:glycosyltransferase involved in cell wall biosynthesis
MKIGLLSFEYPPETGFGGIGTYTWYHARALARLGHEVHVVAGLKEQSPLVNRMHEGVTVHRYRPGGRIMESFDGLGRWKLWWTRQRLENGWSMYQAMKLLQHEHKFDVLEMPECGAEGFLVNSLMSVPAVVRFHSPSRLIMPFYDVRRSDVAVCSFLEQRAIRKATALTSCSGFLGKEVREKLGVRKTITVIPNGIDLALFDSAPHVDVHEKYGIPRNKPLIFFAGRMERRKGIHLCGAIAEKILRRHDVAFVFAGQDLFGYMSGTLLPSLRSPELKGSVHYIGKLDLEELRSFVRVSDIFMLPSIWENCPYSCLEAMASGRAIVSSDQGGMPELIQDGVNGLLAECESPESFTSQIDTLIVNRNLRLRLGENARRSVEQRYTDERIARLTVEVYERLVARKRRAA